MTTIPVINPVKPGIYQRLNTKDRYPWITLNNECMPHDSDDKPGMNPTNKKVLIGFIIGLANIAIFRVLNTIYKRVRMIDMKSKKDDCKKCNYGSMIEFTSLMDGIIISIVSIVIYSKFKKILPEHALIVGIFITGIIALMDLKKKFRIFD